MDGNEAGPGFAVPNLVHWILMIAAIVLTVVVPIHFLPAGLLRVFLGVLLAATGTSL